MKIDKDTIFYFVWTPLSDEMLNDLSETLYTVVDAAADNAKDAGIIPGRKFTTKAYVKIEDRYFRLTFIFIGIPFDIKRCQVDEIFKHEYDEGIEKEKNDPSKKSGWL